ncbi:hypothetical protein [Pantoea sp. USHLN256]|uniref:hypothetical protein n=1 Tax=Pantoea sp. USHLN256 TaxID=3081293 RepID=UPI0030163BCB
MNMPEAPAVTNITLHNPSSCTCGRIIWLTMHCDSFAMNMGTWDVEARIDASIGTISQRKTFPPEMLKEVVAVIFWEMWNAWEPAEGKKVVAE